MPQPPPAADRHRRRDSNRRRMRRRRQPSRTSTAAQRISARGNGVAMTEAATDVRVGRSAPGRLQRRGDETATRPGRRAGRDGRPRERRRRRAHGAPERTARSRAPWSRSARPRYGRRCRVGAPDRGRRRARAARRSCSPTSTIRAVRDAYLSARSQVRSAESALDRWRAGTPSAPNDCRRRARFPSGIWRAPDST